MKMGLFNVVMFYLPFRFILFNIFLAIIDIGIFTFIFYKFYQILYQTKAVQGLKGLFFVVILYVLAKLLGLSTFSWLLDQITSALVLVIIIVFQPELRRILMKFGQSNWLSNLTKRNVKDLNQILNAVQNLHIRQIGALIAFEREVGLKNIIESGTVIDSKISASLILTIFTNKTPLHDGAVIIKSDTIVAAGCLLPLSDTTDINKELGTRHRAAIGLTEESDAVVLVVSEETGKISLSYDGKLHTNYDIDMLRKDLTLLLGYEEGGGEGLSND